MTNNMQGALTPLFQPIADATGKLYAYEALLRLKGGDGDSPLPMVRRWERTGFIRVVDVAMLSCIDAAVQACAWRPRLTVNVSIATIEGDAGGYLDGLRQLAVHARRLVVELTETAPIRDSEKVLRFAADCRANGYGIALDDCTPSRPYGAVEFMRSMQPQMVKIDGEFLHRAMRSGQRSGQVSELQAMIDLARGLGAVVVAESISSQEAHAFALSLGVNLFQGYAIGMPAALPTRADLLKIASNL